MNRADLKLGTVVKIKEFAFTNPQGGTGLSNWEYNEKFTGNAVARIFHKFEDYETGWNYHATAVSNDLIQYMNKNADPKDQRVLISEFDIVEIME